MTLLGGMSRLAGAQQRRDTATCYRITYPSTTEHPDQHFAEYVAVYTAHDSVVRSGMGPSKSIAFWRMFLVGGTWDRRADTLMLHFTNGFSGVLYKLRPTEKDSLSGQVWFLYDVVGQSPPPVSAAAHRISCDDAYLQSLPYTQSESDQKRLDKRRELLQETEETRVHALTSPLAGTYVFEMKVLGSPPVRVYGRTELHPANAVWNLADAMNAPPRDTLGPYVAHGFQLRMAVSYSPDELPQRLGQTDDSAGACAASFTIAEKPSLATTDSTVWKGDADVLFAASRCASDGPTHDALERGSTAVSDVWFNDVPGRTDGRLVLHSNGDAVVTMRVLRRGVLVLSLQGHRIGKQLLVTNSPQ